jgi:hypothetical protein
MRISTVCSALVLAWLGSVGVARAGEAAGTNAPTDAPTVASTPANNPAIAPPSPAAPPEKVDDAKSAAKAAKLTPIVPSPQNPCEHEALNVRNRCAARSTLGPPCGWRATCSW